MSQSEDRIIRFGGLESGRYEYHITLDKSFFECMGNDELRGGKVDVVAKMEKNERGIVFHFELKGEVETWCDRCLGDMSVEIAGEEWLKVQLSDTETSNEEDVAVLPEGTNEIDLSQWLYEYVAVRMPLQHSHEEGQCDKATTDYLVGEGAKVRTHEGEIDPRWEALKQLK